eukprot:TRINITY_DN47605_c0_g1_i1.p1 TRINITY_DN47605_c0_g1~~TRINITY_DN47605_c0_g1_i1.p1  ORF type:complete len:303 (-),score=57.37 TRINITY_DN47605_c0_g1_i1:104-1012(-)
MAVLASSSLWPWPRGGLERQSVDDADAANVERAFELADSVEKGLAREHGAEFMRPLRRSSKLWRFNVARSEDKLEYRLLSDDGTFLMCARVDLDSRRAGFYLYDTHDRLHDPMRPTFTMSFSEDRCEWRLFQERCDNCGLSPKHLSCSSFGKQQVAAVHHVRENVGDAVCNGMCAQVPGIYSDGSQVIWCPMLGRGDLGGSSAASPANACGSSPCKASRRERLHLVARQPQWNPEARSLVLEFKGRSVLSSAKNFQLALRQKPDHVICQFGKIGRGTFALDFKYPLSVVQAFGIAVTTLFWT